MSRSTKASHESLTCHWCSGTPFEQHLHYLRDFRDSQTLATHLQGTVHARDAEFKAGTIASIVTWRDGILKDWGNREADAEGVPLAAWEAWVLASYPEIRTKTELSQRLRAKGLLQERM